MVSPRAWGVVDPVKNDKRQAANHEDDSHDQEDGCLKRERERERQNKKGFSLMRYTEERRGLWKFLEDHIHLALSGYMEKANTVRQQQKALCVTASVFLYTYPNLLWGAQRQRLYQAQVKGSG